MIDIILPAFATLFVIIDPIGLIPVFIGLTQGSDLAYKRKMAIRGVLIGGTILFFFALVGDEFLNVIGIKLYAFRIAGGIMLFLIALEMVFGKRTTRRSERAEETKEEIHQEDISVFPIAIPLLSGPGAITSVMLLMSQQSGSVEGQLTVLGVLLFVLIISLVMFLYSHKLEKILGKTISSIFARLLGVLLAALAAQFVLDGIRQALFS